MKMKSLNDSLREEFNKILKEDTINEKVELDKLDPIILKKAFDVLLLFKYKSDLKDKARGEFENYLINDLKTSN
ncbi:MULTISPECIES: hypothetical protein [Tenacibaculum]|uniref:hypothetical protein n=1 Tax=Tenacibaculum TaxID=104267 RepID=UPI001E2C32A2|nr:MULTISPECIES: hypothetical protein [Tenacibaculum]